MLETIEFQRSRAVAYAKRWALGRNPAYLDFQGLGGDCTNFVSQCLLAGGGVMNDTPTFGWYYRSASDRTPSWTGVEYLFRFLVDNEKEGPFAVEAELSAAQPGDVIQLGDLQGHFYHSLFIAQITGEPALPQILVCTHSDDALLRPLDGYFIANFRLLHIQGVRRRL